MEQEPNRAYLRKILPYMKLM